MRARRTFRYRPYDNVGLHSDIRRSPCPVILKQARCDFFLIFLLLLLLLLHGTVTIGVFTIHFELYRFRKIFGFHYTIKIDERNRVRVLENRHAYAKQSEKY